MRRPRILVIDDSVTVLQVLESALTGQYDVDTAAGGADGLAKARRTRPDLIVTDSVMPGIDGIALLRTLKEDPATSSIPAIVLTSDETSNLKTGVGDPRPAAVVTKSMDMAPLLAAIRSALAARILL